MKRKLIFRDGGDRVLAGLQLNLSLILLLFISVSSPFIHPAHSFLSSHCSLSYVITTEDRALMRDGPLKRMKGSR